MAQNFLYYFVFIFVVFSPADLVARKFDLKNQDPGVIKGNSGIKPEAILSYDDLFQCVIAEDSMISIDKKIKISEMEIENYSKSILFIESNIKKSKNNPISDLHSSLMLKSEIDSLSYYNNIRELSIRNMNLSRQQFDASARYFNNKCRDFFFYMDDLIKARKIIVQID